MMRSPISGSSSGNLGVDVSCRLRGEDAGLVPVLERLRALIASVLRFLLLAGGLCSLRWDDLETSLRLDGVSSVFSSDVMMCTTGTCDLCGLEEIAQIGSGEEERLCWG